jgi:hypothetical protein
MNVERWRLLLPASRTNERAALDPSALLSAEFLEFQVANGHLIAGAHRTAGANTQAEPPRAEGTQSIERVATALSLDEPVSLEWSEGERAVIFETEVPRNQVRTLRVSGPAHLAWALFEPGADGAWRARRRAPSDSPVARAK